jgi:IS30 family transposase
MGRYCSRLTRAEQAAVWRRYRAGEPVSGIAAGLVRHVGAVSRVIRARGGIAPAAPVRRAGTLDRTEREVIARGLASRTSLRATATALGRAASTISREVHRNGGPRAYRASVADDRAWAQAARPKPCRLATQPTLCAVVADALACDWSPAQIAGWLRATYPEDRTMQVAAETIYRTLYVQARGALKRELIAHLRTQRPVRRSRQATAQGQGRGQIVDAISISARPAEAADRAVPGHWEGDLLAGGHNSYVATLVERRSRFVQLVRVEGKDTRSVVGALIAHVQRLPQGVMRSLTWDRGMELAQHRAFTVATDVQVYFCDPQSPWQRGSNENTNGLLRQYLPKGKDFRGLTQDDLDTIAWKLNTRPRQTLGFRMPGQVFNSTVALTD